MDKYLGKRLEGRYEIQELVGVGGMANVYKAYDVIDQRDVAVKILREEYLGNHEFLRRFKNESKAIAVLSHPNIVRVYDVSFTNRVHSIVMEYINGITLKDYIERQRILSWKEAVHFTLQILRALQHAHDKGIVHRDIKPHNIMLMQNGTVKMTDFGIARFARSEVKTITDRAIGSVHYISPEQAMGENTDEKSDIYSVGVMLFEMLTGKLPFEAETAVSVAIKQIQTQAARPTALNPAIPEGLEDITMRAMQKDASKRYQSAAEMISDIERFKQNPSIQFQYKYLEQKNERADNKKYGRAIKNTRETGAVRRRKRTPYIPILTGVTFAFMMASLGFIALMIYLNNPFTKVEDVTIPTLVGMKFETAVAMYDFIEIVVEETVNSDIHGRGVITDQDPRADRQVKTGATVKVKVSSGQRLVTLENFEGKDAKQVLAWLEEKGLAYKRENIYSSDVPEGSVIYTDPSKNSEVGAGTTVTVYVSLGPEEMLTNVPSVEGLTLERAKQMLEMYSLRVGEVTYEEHDALIDTVASQDPQPGVALEGTAVNLVISKGRDSSYRQVSIPVPLPYILENVTVTAQKDGKTVFEEVINPAEVGTWRPYIGGDASETNAVIAIYISGKLYKHYTLDYSTDPPQYVEHPVDSVYG